MRRLVLSPALLALPLAAVIAACSAASSPSPSPSSAGPSPTAEASLPASSPSAEASVPGMSAETSAGAAVEIVGVEYAFENVPQTTDVGTEFSFRNGGEEAHEMGVVRKNEGVTESFEELLALPEDQAFAFVTFVGQTMANPGETATGTVVADQPGEYMMVCFFPTGMTEIPTGSIGPDASLPTGAPHFTQGMLAEFTVE